jgi:hypothetical protein
MKTSSTPERGLLQQGIRSGAQRTTPVEKQRDPQQHEEDDLQRFKEGQSTLFLRRTSGYFL